MDKLVQPIEVKLQMLNKKAISVNAIEVGEDVIIGESDNITYEIGVNDSNEIVLKEQSIGVTYKYHAVLEAWYEVEATKAPEGGLTVISTLNNITNKSSRIALCEDVNSRLDFEALSLKHPFIKSIRAFIEAQQSVANIESDIEREKASQQGFEDLLKTEKDEQVRLKVQNSLNDCISLIETLETSHKGAIDLMHFKRANIGTWNLSEVAGDE